MSDDTNSMLTVESVHGVTVMTIRREQLTDEDNLEDFGRRIQDPIAADSSGRFVLDVSTLRYVTSSVLGKWITAHRSLGRSGGRLVICGIGKDLGDILDATRLRSLFETADDRAAALALLEAS